MSQVDQVSSSMGVNSVLNKQQAKYASLLQEMATGTTRDSIANALAVPLETEASGLSVVQQNVAIAGNALSAAQGALASVSGNLTQMLGIASEALSAPASVRSTLSQQYNDLLQQTSSYVGNAAINGINLVSSSASSMTVNTTTHGGQITVSGAASDAQSLGVASTGAAGWTSAAAVNASIGQLQSAIAQVSSTQASFAAAQNTLTFAAQVNQSTELANAASEAALTGADIGAVAAGAASSRTQSEAAIAASTQQNKLTRSVLELFKNG